MKRSISLKAILAAITMSLITGCVERETVVEAPTPPPPQIEVIPVAPNPTYVWIGGNWEWRGGWVWVGGRWGHRPYPGATWVHGHWARHGHARVWISAGWR